jgi:hypothetical protein
MQRKARLLVFERKDNILGQFLYGINRSTCLVQYPTGRYLNPPNHQPTYLYVHRLLALLHT